MVVVLGHIVKLKEGGIEIKNGGLGYSSIVKDSVSTVGKMHSLGLGHSDCQWLEGQSYSRTAMYTD